MHTASVFRVEHHAVTLSVFFYAHQDRVPKSARPHLIVLAASFRLRGARRQCVPKVMFTALSRAFSVRTENG